MVVVFQGFVIFESFILACLSVDVIFFSLPILRDAIIGTVVHVMFLIFTALYTVQATGLVFGSYTSKNLPIFFHGLFIVILGFSHHRITFVRVKHVLKKEIEADENV